MIGKSSGRGEKLKMSVVIKSRGTYDFEVSQTESGTQECLQFFSSFFASTCCLLCTKNHQAIVETHVCAGLTDVDKVKGKLECLTESKTICEALMDEGTADLTLCLRLSQDVSEEPAYL